MTSLLVIDFENFVIFTGAETHHNRKAKLCGMTVDDTNYILMYNTQTTHKCVKARLSSKIGLHFVFMKFRTFSAH